MRTLETSPKTATRTLVIAGGAGMLGQILARRFLSHGWNVITLARTAHRPLSGTRLQLWDGKTVSDWAQHLEGATAIMNLSGRSVNCRYTRRNRRAMMNSRIDSTRILGEAICRCRRPPEVWLNSSTATIYKHTFGPAWDETGQIGASPEAHDAFSIDIATAWERELFNVATPATRKIAMRTAIVLSNCPGNFITILRTLVRLGLGGRMAGGQQYVSWIHELDFCRAVEFLLDHEAISGVVNIAAPAPVTNSQLMQMFREIVGIPVGLPAPRWLLEIGAFFHRTETELIIKSRRVMPGKLMEAGFTFQFPEMRGTLTDLLGN